MRACPACRQRMNVLQFRQLEIDACPSCGGFWFDGGELEALVPRETVQRVLEAARGKAGRCKACNERIPLGIEECRRCEIAAPTCPECGAAPLSVGNVNGVNLDVCGRCAGIFLDAGELQLLTRNSSDVALLQSAAITRNTPPEAPPPSSRVICIGCARQVRRSHAFVLDDQIYCGSCCPTGAAPLVVKLSRADDGSYDRRYNSGYGHHPHHHHQGYSLVNDHEEASLVRLLNFLFS